MSMKVDWERVRCRANEITIRRRVVKDAILSIEHRFRERDRDGEREPISCPASAYRAGIHTMVRKPCFDQVHCDTKLEQEVRYSTNKGMIDAVKLQ